MAHISKANARKSILSMLRNSSLWDELMLTLLRRKKLMNIAKNAVLDRCDHIQVTRKFAENFRVTFDEVSEETARRYEADEFLRRVQKAVSWMPPARRKVFLLSRFYGMDNKSIASLCELSVRTVETHLFHATQYLRKKLLP